MELSVVIILSSLLIGAGLIGVVLPFIPGVPLAWLGVLFYGYHTGFETISVSTVAWLFLVAAVTVIIDLIAPVLGAERYNSSKSGTFGAIIGLFVGMLILGPFGIVLGPPLGAFSGEMLAGKDSKRALQSAWGSFVGFVISTVLKLIAVVVIASVFIAALV